MLRTKSKRRLARPRGLVLVAFGVGTLLVVQMVVSVVGAVVSQRGAEAAARDIYAYVGDTMASRVGAFADSAGDVVHGTADQLLRAHGVPAQDELVQSLVDRLRREPAVGSIWVGTPDGAGIAAARTPTGFEMLVIDPHADGTLSTATRVYYDATLVETRRVTETWEYDLLGRPWYQLAVGSFDMEWTAPYISARTGEIVVSPVRAVRVGGEVIGVVGADLDSGEMSSLLDSIPIGGEARGFVLTADGQVVAAPSAFQDELYDALSESGVVPSADALGLDAVEHGGGFVEHFHSDSGGISLHRSLDSGAGLDWVLHLESDTADLAPGLEAFAGASLAVAGTSLAVVALGIGIALRVWHPLRVMRHRASTDALTGLANRYEFHRHGRSSLGVAQATGGTIVVVVLDLDHFKSLNDRYGHEAGDVVLAAVGVAMRGSMRHGDVAARLGGDEFVALFELRRRGSAADLASRLRDAVEVAVQGSGDFAREVGVTAGYATSDTVGYDLRALQRAADAAMVAGKRRSKGRTYGPETAASAQGAGAVPREGVAEPAPDAEVPAGSLPGD